MEGWHHVSRWTSVRLERSLRLLRALNALRAWLGRVRPPEHWTARRDAALAEARLREWDADCRAKVDARQLNLFFFVLLVCVGCSDAFTPRFESWPIDGSTPSVDAGTSESGTTSPVRVRNGSTRVSTSTDSGDAGAGTTTVDARTIRPFPDGPSNPPSKDAASEHRVPPDVAPPPACVRYVGAVFVCSGATPVAYYPCPVRPQSCVQAGNTAIVCCPN